MTKWERESGRKLGEEEERNGKVEEKVRGKQVEG